MPGSIYTKYDFYKCEICGKDVQKWNKWQHNKMRYHKLLEFCKKRVNEIIEESQLNSAPKV